MLVSPDFKTILLYTTIRGGGMIPLTWKEDQYVDTSERIIQVERPTFVKATVKRVTTEDGIMQSRTQVGDVYKMQVNSMEMAEWGHVDHPGKKWNRMSAIFYNKDGVGGQMPIELFEIETN
jgi:hypothetical protein